MESCCFLARTKKEEEEEERTDNIYLLPMQIMKPNECEGECICVALLLLLFGGCHSHWWEVMIAHSAYTQKSEKIVARKS